MTNGFYQMHRGWMDHPVFKKEPFTDREAWIWLIEHAAWKPTVQSVGVWNVEVERGQYATSVRYLAKAWGWSKRRVEGFEQRLKSVTMIGTQSGTRYTVITICNYDVYQARACSAGTPQGTGTGTQRGHGGDKEEEGKEGKKKDSPSGYAFKGQVVRLNQEHYDKWRSVYDAIPDFDAFLEKQDAYYSSLTKEELGNWFVRCSTAAEKAHQAFLAKRAVPEADAPAPERFTPEVEKMRLRRQREAIDR